MDLRDLDLPRRVVGVLEAHGIDTVAKLVELNERELSALPRFGKHSLSALLDSLAARGILLAVDPWAPSECARDGRLAWDVTLTTFFLCDECASQFTERAFAGRGPEFVGGSMEGRCSHCNLVRELRIRQWSLCAWCDRVLRSIGRSVASARFVMETWADHVQPQVPSVSLREIDPARLQRLDAATKAAKVASADFEGTDTKTGELLFAIELKTGRSRLDGETIGAPMKTFQLDQGDCDDITAVAVRDRVPVYLVHAQLIDRVEPPTVRYAPVALWWTDPFAMRDNFIESKQRPREAKIAAYYKTTMFRRVPELIAHLKDDGPRKLRERIANEGLPDLYEAPPR